MDIFKVDVLVIGDIKAKEEISVHSLTGDIDCHAGDVDFDNLPDTITVRDRTYDISDAIVIDAPDNIHIKQIKVMGGKILLATGDVIAFYPDEKG